jgi:transposase-like protein
VRLRRSEREAVRIFWRSHFDVWELSGLTQHDYCVKHGLNLKSFGNWRAQLKREAAAGDKARWGRYPRLRKGDSHMANSMASHMAGPRVKRAVPLGVAPTERRREYSEEAKRRILDEARRPGGSLSEVARRYRIDLRLLFRWRRALGLESTTEPVPFLPVRIAEEGEAAGEPAEAILPPSAPSIIVERVAPAIEVELIGGRRVRFDRDVDPETMKRVVSALEGDAP